MNKHERVEEFWEGVEKLAEYYRLTVGAVIDDDGEPAIGIVADEDRLDPEPLN